MDYIALDRTTFTYNSSMKWDGIPTVAEELKQDNYFYNLFARELEKFYERSVDLAWQQIDAKEMETVADQAKKAGKRQ